MICKVLLVEEYCQNQSTNMLQPKSCKGKSQFFPFSIIVNRIHCVLLFKQNKQLLKTSTWVWLTSSPSAFRSSSSRSRDFADSKYLLHHGQFNTDVLPDSHKRPYLIKVTSEWCFACIHIEPVWKETVLELEPLGKSAGAGLPAVRPRTLRIRVCFPKKAS